MLNALEELRRIRAGAIPTVRVPISAPTKPTEGETVAAAAVLCPCPHPAFDPAASAVLGILVRAGQPVPHSQIVQEMAEQGYDKTTARKAIASCQSKRWIEHNLISGYVLSSMEGCEEPDTEKKEQI